MSDNSVKVTSLRLNRIKKDHKAVWDILQGVKKEKNQSYSEYIVEAVLYSYQHKNEQRECQNKDSVKDMIRLTVAECLKQIQTLDKSKYINENDIGNGISVEPSIEKTVFDFLDSL